MFPSIEILLTVFISSLLGSLHCVGMCGGLVAYCCIASPHQQVSRRLVLAEIAYHSSRLVSYMLLGALAGSIGNITDALGEAAGFQRGFGLVAGILLIAWGVHDLGFFRSSTIGSSTGPGKSLAFNSKVLSLSLFRAPLRLTGIPRGAFVGLLSGLLPCGWLYAYVLSAAATQHPVAGAIFMATFWLGTVPLLALFARVVKKLNSSWLTRLPKLTAVVVILFGILAISGKLNVNSLAGHEHTSTAEPASCH